MGRRTQDMSVPGGAPSTGGTPSTGGNPPNMRPSLPPQPANLTAPPVVPITVPPVVRETPSPIVTPGVPATGPPAGVVTGPPVPVAAVICAQAETCIEEGKSCSDGTTEACCGDVFDSFTCDCVSVNGSLEYECKFTDACLDITCGTEPPVSGPDNSTPSPVPPPATGFNCPAASIVGCTAVDITDPQDDCPTVGDLCPGSTIGEFCCTDGCPRNYCTAKQAPTKRSVSKQSSVSIKQTVQTDLTAFVVPMPADWPKNASP